MGVIREKLAKAACSIYAIESMIYLTTGIIDTYEKADVDIEAAIIKVRESICSCNLLLNNIKIAEGLIVSSYFD